MRLAGIVFLLFLSSAGYSNIFNVTSTTDGNAPNQLRGAIAAAVAAGPGPHTINVAAGTYDLTLGQISFGNTPITLTITGADPATTVIIMTTNPITQDRIFLINPTGTVANVNVTIQNFTITGGHLIADSFGGGAILGGGPFNTTTITNCIFTANTIDPAKGGSGGAVAIEGGGTTIIDHCSFSSNSSPTGGGGALFYFLPNSASGSLSITNSTFNNNSTTLPNGDGGALLISVQGAIGPTTSSITIQRNTFLSNHANTAGGEGGAIGINNAFGPGNTANISFNRFVGNTANNAATSGLAMFSAPGNVNADNNWWGCNENPLIAGSCNRASLSGSGGTGTLQLSNWIQLKTSSTAASICSGSIGNSTSVTATFKSSSGASLAAGQLTALIGLPVTFSASPGNISNAQTMIQADGTATATYTAAGGGLATVNALVDNVPPGDVTGRTFITENSSPTIISQPSTLSVCPGNEASLTVSALGSNTYAWFRNTTPLSDGTTTSGSVITGAATATLSIRNSSNQDNAADYNVLVTSGNGCSTRSDNAPLSVAALVIPATNSNVGRTISINDFAVNDGSCKRIALVQPSGANPASGAVDAIVTINTGQPAYNGQPYVKRHYDISPITNPNTATATITLYFLQSEFDAYNAATPGTTTDLPVGPSDVTGRSNLRVTQYHGVGSSPGNYTGWSGVGPKTVLINPGGGNVVWNSTSNLWEVTFPVTGFSGFYITGLINGPLPVTLLSFEAVKAQNRVLIKWEAGREVDFSHYDVETSSDGRNYHTIGIVTATNSTTYSFVHNNPANGINYYRLKMVDLNGTVTYSKVVSVLFSTDTFAVQVLSNPFRQNLNIRIDADKNAKIEMLLTDQAGKILTQKNISINKGTNTITLPANYVANGIYLLRINGGGYATTIKVLKSQ